MRSRSSKQAELYRAWKPVRLDFLWERPVCCECGGAACDVHEILAGSNRQRAFTERCCWLRVCRECHDKIQGVSIVYQLALKLLSDPDGFDLVKFHEVWGRPATAITPAEVLDAVRTMLIRKAA